MESGLERALAEVYGGPLEDFVRRRDSLAKELRSAGERESASTVKGLRKPSRTAWALNLGVRNGPHAIGPLVTAVTETLDAQAGGGDVRAAITRLRVAVREFASGAAHAAEQAGHAVEPGVLSNAVLAVLGRPESFDQLRGGCLADIPEAGGLDFLATLPRPLDVPAAPATSREAAATDASLPQRAELESAAREAARALADARIRAQVAERALRDAESKLHTAEERLRVVEQELHAARDRCDGARHEAEAAAARLVEAERAAAEGERRVASRDRQ